MKNRTSPLLSSFEFFHLLSLFFSSFLSCNNPPFKSTPLASVFVHLCTFHRKMYNSSYNLTWLSLLLLFSHCTRCIGKKKVQEIELLVFHSSVALFSLFRAIVFAVWKYIFSFQLCIASLQVKYDSWKKKRKTHTGRMLKTSRKEAWEMKSEIHRWEIHTWRMKNSWCISTRYFLSFSLFLCVLCAWAYPCEWMKQISRSRHTIEREWRMTSLWMKMTQKLWDTVKERETERTRRQVNQTQRWNNANCRLALLVSLVIDICYSPSFALSNSGNSRCNDAGQHSCQSSRVSCLVSDCCYLRPLVCLSLSLSLSVQRFSFSSLHRVTFLIFATFLLPPLLFWSTFAGCGVRRRDCISLSLPLSFCLLHQFTSPVSSSFSFHLSHAQRRKCNWQGWMRVHTLSINLQTVHLVFALFLFLFLFFSTNYPVLFFL